MHQGRRTADSAQKAAKLDLNVLELDLTCSRTPLTLTSKERSAVRLKPNRMRLSLNLIGHHLAMGQLKIPDKRPVTDQRSYLDEIV